MSYPRQRTSLTSFQFQYTACLTWGFPCNTIYYLWHLNFLMLFIIFMFIYYSGTRFPYLPIFRASNSAKDRFIHLWTEVFLIYFLWKRLIENIGVYKIVDTNSKVPAMLSWQTTFTHFPAVHPKQTKFLQSLNLNKNIHIYSCKGSRWSKLISPGPMVIFISTIFKLFFYNLKKREFIFMTDFVLWTMRICSFSSQVISLKSYD